MNAEIPPIGTRYEFRKGRTAHRVWELVESLPEGTKSTAERHGCDRHTLRCVEEVGLIPSECYGVGTEIHVEDAWFANTVARRVA